MRIYRERYKYWPVLRWVFSPMRTGRRLYDHVIPLGCNCEVAYRFYRSYGFLESSLLAWTFSTSLEQLCDALSRYEEMFSTVVYNVHHGLYECLNTGLMMHGRDSMTKWMMLNSDAREHEIGDVVGRARYLKEKFCRVVADDCSKLFVYKIRTADADESRVCGQLDRLDALLRGLGAKNHDLLIVCERESMARLSGWEGEGHFIRFVERFNPDDNVATEKLGDTGGWRRLFASFGPVVLGRRKHAFKFER